MLANFLPIGQRRAMAGPFVLFFRQAFHLSLTVVAMAISKPSMASEPHPPLPRPQTPVPPFPYLSEEVHFPARVPGVMLAGTLTAPREAKPSAGIVLLAGSGRFDRDEVIAGHRIFLVWADDFTRHGFAVLRIDKRGVGKSTGNYAEATNWDFADDAEAAFDFLVRRLGPQVKRVGFVGHSGGATVASIVAARRADVGFVVLVGAAGVPGVEIIIAQDEEEARAAGLSDAKIALRLRLDRELLELVAREKDSPDLVADVRRLVERQQAIYPMGNKPVPPVEDTVRNVTGPWFREDMAYKPAPTLRQVSCPVLVVAGSLDHQVFPRQNLPLIEAALKTGKTHDYTVREIPGVNHLLQEAKTGLDSEYKQLEQTASVPALQLMADWIAQLGDASPQADRRPRD